MPTLSRGPLPVEVLQQIGPLLSRCDVASLRLASSQFSKVFIPFLVNELTLEVSKAIKVKTVKDDYATAVPFVLIPESLASFIKTLSIHLAPHRAPGPFSSDSVDRVEKEIARLKSVKKFATRTIIASTLASHIEAHMMTLQHRMLPMVMDGNQATLESVGFGCTLLRALESMHPPLPKSLWMFKGLSLFQPDQNNTHIPQVKEIISKSSALESLEVGCTKTNQIFIQDIFPSNSAISHFPLRELTLYGNIEWLPNSPFSMMPSFACLRRLALFVPETPHTLDEFWDFLRTTNVRLEYLCLEHPISTALVRYLPSYKGIQELVFTANWEEDITRTESQSIAEACQFHAATLTTLAIA